MKLALIKNDNLKSWQSSNISVEALSRPCLCRLLRAFQLELVRAEVDLSTMTPQPEGARFIRRRVVCGPSKVSVFLLQKWRQEQKT